MSSAFFRTFLVTTSAFFASTVLLSLPALAVEHPPIKDSAYQAKFVRQSVPDPLRLTTGATTSVIVTFRNTGSAAWAAKGAGRATIFTFDPKYRTSVFADRSWVNAYTAARLATAVQPGAEGSFTLILHAPEEPGTYREQFYLAAEDRTWIDKGYFYLDIVVTTKPQSKPTVAPSNNITMQQYNNEPQPNQPVSESSATSQTSTSSRSLIIEPTVRVGLLKTTTSVPVDLKFPYQIYLGETFQNFVNASSTVVLSYENGQHVVRDEQGLVLATGADPVRLVPVTPSDYFVLPANERRIKGRPYPFNAYRGIMEFRFSKMSSTTVVINELPLDWYVAGITETWDGAPYEYIKALLIAARSYAYFQLEHEKPKDSLFHVFASTHDQLYLGYDAELSMPRVAKAQRETYGQMVTYQGLPVVTPYSSRTNGKTRTWKEAWGGTNKPWLVPVEAKYDKGKTRLGHGVGMSNNDATLRAQKDGWDYVTILKHYYTGTEIEKIY